MGRRPGRPRGRHHRRRPHRRHHGETARGAGQDQVPLRHPRPHRRRHHRHLDGRELPQGRRRRPAARRPRRHRRHQPPGRPDHRRPRRQPRPARRLRQPQGGPQGGHPQHGRDRGEPIVTSDHERFFQLSRDLLATSTFDGRFVDLNPAWHTTLGWSLDELRARPFLEFVHPDDRASTLDETARLGQPGHESVHFENRYRCLDGSYRWLSWTSVHVPGESRLYCAARDITERKLAAEQHERTVDEMRRRHQVQQDALHAMASPIIEIWDQILSLPIVGIVDSVRAADMKQALLESIFRTTARYVIVDLTGVDTVDTATADHLLTVMRSVRLLGAQGVITGIQPQVAQTIVALGVDMREVVTLRSLREGLKFCLRHLGYRVEVPAAETVAF
ncbi:MAG: PAS domain S-box protein [Myxococcales bacterium]|nr:MAG: PAS domain S-box protein [Myxococcales bacterium]